MKFNQIKIMRNKFAKQLLIDILYEIRSYILY